MCSQCVRAYDRNMRLKATSIGGVQLLCLEETLAKERLRADNLAQQNLMLQRQLEFGWSMRKMRQLGTVSSRPAPRAAPPQQPPQQAVSADRRQRDTTRAEGVNEESFLGSVLSQLALRRMYDR
eukprot:COSAG02_NODE_7450_length_3008_cov_1.793056_2_plen_124_part_00